MFFSQDSNASYVGNYQVVWPLLGVVAESEERRVGLLAEELQLGGVLERAEVILFTQLKKNGKNEAGDNLVSSYSTPN